MHIKKFFFLILLSQLFAKIGNAQPCFSGYQYRTPIFFDNRTNSGLRDFQIKLTINTSSLVSAGKMKSSGDDIRFLDRLGSPLSYWIESGTMNTSSTSIWVKLDSVAGYSRDTIFVYYGNSGASGISSSNSVFSFFEDFSGSTLNTSIWNACGSGSFTVSGGNLRLTSNTGASNKAAISSVTEFDFPFTVEMYVNSSSNGKSFIGQLNTAGNGYSSVLNSNMGLESVAGGSNCFTNTAFGSTVSAGSITGQWSFNWNTSNNITSTWPGGSLNLTNTTYSPSGRGKIHIGNFDNSGYLDIAWIRVRKSASSLPTITFGREINMNFTVTASYQTPLCSGGDLKLFVDSVPGSKYRWTGPNGFNSILQNPVLTGVTSTDAGLYIVTVEIPRNCATKTTSVNVNVSPRARGGNTSGSQTVCGGSNLGLISLSGQVGNVIAWDSAYSNTGPWYRATSSALTRSYNNLTSTTYYRAIVANGGCSTDSSTIAVITVTPPSNGGTISGSDSVCSGSNSGIVTLSGYTGSIMGWEYSENGNLWFSIVNRSTVHAYSNLTKTTYYRAVIQNGLCNAATSVPAVIKVDLPSVGGSINGGGTVCENLNTGVLRLSGHRGNVIRWETSYTGSSPWNSFSNTTDSFRFNNLSTTTYYRAVIQNGMCSFTNSSPVAVNIIPKSNGGSILGSTTVCEGSNFGILTVTSYTGTVQNWLSYNKNTGWSTISSITNTISWSGLSDTTTFYTIVKNGSCSQDTSDKAIIYVNPQSQSGYLTGASQVCSGNNSGIIKLNSYLGAIKSWESSTTGFAPWTNLGRTSDTLNFSNLSQTLYYRASVQSGVCSKTYANPIEIKVDAKTVAGTLQKPDSVCEGSNFGILNITGNTGLVTMWEASNDGVNNWSRLSQTSQTYTYANLNNTTYYRAIIKSGVCNDEKTNVVKITINTTTNSGEIHSDFASCGNINSGFVKLKNYNGTILSWESSETGKSPWTYITKDIDSVKFTNLNKTTFYRALVKSGKCFAEYSQIGIVKVSASSEGGILSSNITNVCESGNVGNISLKNYEGNITDWIYKAEGESWKSLNNLTNQYVFFNLNKSTSFRAIVKSNDCPEDTSNMITINVSPNTNSGFTYGNQTVCNSINNGYVYVKNSVGTILGWEEAPTSIGPWSIISNTNDTLQFNNISASTYFRMKVQSGNCQVAYSNPVLVNLDNKTNAGILEGNNAICKGINSGDILLTNFEGNVQKWQSSLDGITWNNISNTSNKFTYINISENTKIRTIVKNGTCIADTTASFQLRTMPVPTGLSFTSNNLCDGSISEFEANATISSGSITNYFWKISDGFSSADQKFSKAFLNPGTFVVNLEVSSDSNCKIIFTKTIRVEQSPIADFALNSSISQGSNCLADSAYFINTTRTNTTCTYLWKFEDGTILNTKNANKKFNTPGNYFVTLISTSPNGCVDSVNKYITILPYKKPSAGPDFTISKGINAKLLATGGISYHWQPKDKVSNENIPNPTINIQEKTQFIVTSTDINGCTANDTVWVDVIDDYRVIPNNVITPEGNGQNDVWVINNIENYPDNHISVFDRWGREVMKTDAYKNDWGATNKNGDLLIDGTYYYVITFNSSDIVQKGAITVIRNK